MKSRLVGTAALALVALANGGAGADEWRAGEYVFSDRAGGFEILSVTGSGTRDDPIVVEEILETSDPVTLIIRRNPPDGAQPPMSNGRALHLVKQVHNRSGRVWAGFEMELQEIRGRPSVYRDGLSFDQGRQEEAAIGSDRFARHRRIFEPFDRILFYGGFVDPAERSGFALTITDPTPTKEFYLLQHPQLLFSSREPMDACGSGMPDRTRSDAPGPEEQLCVADDDRDEEVAPVAVARMMPGGPLQLDRQTRIDSAGHR